MHTPWNTAWPWCMRERVRSTCIIIMQLFAPDSARHGAAAASPRACDGAVAPLLALFSGFSSPLPPWLRRSQKKTKMGMSAMAAALVMLLLTSIATSAGILREGIASLSSSSSPTQCPWACNASLPSFQWQARIANVSGGPEPSQPTRCYLAGLFDTTIKPPSLATMPGQLGAWSDVGNFSTIHSAFWKAKPSADSIPGHVALPATLRLVGDQGLSTPNASAGFIWTLELKILSCCGEPEATLVAELFSSDSRCEQPF
eukprot:SAG31_NODE_376_length_16541_cov_4.520922_6_plen_258_part_00